MTDSQGNLPFPPLNRGERNHNPGNLEFNPRILYEGLANPPHDGVYYRFIDDEHGIRALAVDVHVKWKKDGLHTIKAIIEKYAPPSDNDTIAYIKDICAHFGIDYVNAGVTTVDLSQPYNLQVFVAAVIRHEEGRVIYPTVLITKCCCEALGIPYPPMPTSQPQAGA